MNRVLFASLSIVLSAACTISIPAGGHVAGIRLQEEVERVDVRALELAPEDVLTLLTSYGSVEVVAADDRAPELRATLRAHGRNADEARAVLERYSVRLERGPDGPKAELEGEPLHVRSGASHTELTAVVDFVATVPTGTNIAATSGFGNLDMRGDLGDLELETGYGEVRIESARGHVDAESGAGDVEALHFEGHELRLESGYGEVRIENARARRIAGESGSGNVRAGSVSADELELSTGYGSVHVKAATGAVKAWSGSGDVRLHEVEGSVEAESGYGSVEIDGVLSEVDAESGSGDVLVRARHGSRVASSWELVSGYGRVVLALPEGFACELDARTGYGSIECELSVDVEERRRDDDTLRGTLGAGGGRVVLESGSGNVVLKKL